ncbi:MAG: hypothetical protein PVF37_21550 [Desulfobacterales bacterium]|jgi:hypothetical protein
MINFKKARPGELRSQPPPHRVVTGPQNKDLGGATANAFSNLLLTEHLSMSKGLKLTRQHPVERSIERHHPLGTRPSHSSFTSCAGSYR